MGRYIGPRALKGLISLFLKIHVNITLLSAPGQGLLCPSVFLPKITYAFLNSTIYATCSVSLTHLHLRCFLSLRSKYSSQNCALKHIYVLRSWRIAKLHAHITNVKLQFSHFNVTTVFSCTVVVATMDKLDRNLVDRDALCHCGMLTERLCTSEGTSVHSGRTAIYLTAALPFSSHCQ